MQSCYACASLRMLQHLVLHRLVKTTMCGNVPSLCIRSESFDSDCVMQTTARKPSVIDMEDLDIAIHSWDINPEHIEICKRPSGRPWMLGSGARCASVELSGLRAC